VHPTFRRLTDDDLPLLHRWLNEPGVVRWWEGDDVSWDAVVRDYGSTSDPRVEHWLASIDREPVAWLQCYRADLYVDDPEDGGEARAWFAAGAHPDAASIDYLVGDPDRRDRGTGSAVIGAFVDAVVFGLHPAWSQVVVSPLVANTASWRALERAGFRRLADVDIDGTACRVVARDRPVEPT
jgi:aminoglycoside 6'-N-acetyltransferase